MGGGPMKNKKRPPLLDKLCAVLKKRRELEANELFSLCDAMGIDPDTLRRYRASDNQSQNRTSAADNRMPS